MTLQEMYEFVEGTCSLQHQVIRQVNAIEAAIEKGDFPVRVGNFIVKDKDTLVISRPNPFSCEKQKR